MTYKKLPLVFLLLITSFFGFGQTKIAELTFETSGGYTTSILEFTNGSEDYFLRTDGSDIASAMEFLNIQGSYFFASHDIDAQGATLPVSLLIDNININGYTNLEFRVYLAEDDDGTNQDWDSFDYVHFYYDIDNSGAFSNLLWVESTGGTNTVPSIDTDYNGTGDGTAITNTFTQFSNSITGTGSLLDIQITFYLDSGDEDIAIDNIEIWGIATSPTINVTPPNLTGFTYDEDAGGPSPEQSFTIEGTNLTDDIAITPPTNYEISTGTGVNFNSNIANPITLTESGGIINSTTIYTRLKSGLTAGSYIETITSTSSGATTQNVSVNGTVTNAIDWCNLQNPSSGSGTLGGNFWVDGYIWEGGVTDSPGQGANIEAWIGYSTTDATSVSDFSSGWTWVPASYYGDSGNNDQYHADIISGTNGITSAGTYYYVSRFRLNGSSSPFSYGGTNSDGLGGGNFWDGSNYVSGVLTVDLVDWCNLQNPSSGTGTLGGNFWVDGYVWEGGVTDSPGQGANIEAWIGYSTTDATSVSDFSSGWTWVPASYYGDSGNNDQYHADIISGTNGITSAGTYYYVSRFRLNGSSSPFSYGGTNSDGLGGGNFWDGSNFVSGVLTITPDPCSELFISEYIEGSSDNKYIEIYNPTSSSISLDGIYSIRIFSNGNSAPSSTINLTGNIAAYDVFVLAHSSATLIGSPDQTSGSLTFNGDDAVALFKSEAKVDVIGQIGTDPGSEWSGSTCTEGTAEGTLVRNSTIQSGDTNGSDSFNPDDEWTCYSQNTSTYLGSHTSDCQSPTPEIQLVDNTANNQNCGFFTIDFGTQANSTNTDITFEIVNAGSADLTIASINLIGSGDFNIQTSLSFPLVLSPGGSQIISVRFTPSNDGIKNATLTINSDDSDESSCNVQLTGEGFTPVPEIDIENNNNASISSSTCVSNPPNTGNNTQFAATDVGDTSTPKTYYIHNEGTSDLTVTSLTLASGVDFNIINGPSLPITITAGNSVSFEIEFSPNTTGSLEDTVTILSDDSDEGTYTFCVGGTGLCIASHIITSFAPTSGPIGSEVTIIGTGFSASSTVNFNGGIATVISQTSTELVVEVPIDASTGFIVVSENTCDVESSVYFNLTNYTGDCTLSDLIMTEIYDASSFSLGYIEIYNGTGNAINLTNYFIRRYGDSTKFNDNEYTDYYFSPSLTNINNNTVLYGKISTSADTASPDFDYTPVGGSAGINGEDIFHLYNGSTLIDVYIVTETNAGYVARRNVNTTGPNLVSNPSDWTISGTENETDLGIFPFAITNNPLVTNQPVNVNCDSHAEFSIQATAGEGGTLTYQWYYNNGTSSNWNPVNSGDFPLATISGETSDTFTISSGFYNYLNYQFYCLVTEDGGCSTASNAAQINVKNTTWDGSSWDNGAPDIDTIAIIDGDYTTGQTNQPSFSACNLIVNSGNQLIVDNYKYVEIVNDVILEGGSIIVETHGNFVQINDTGTFTVNSGGLSRVNKSTAPLDNWYEYTYWSSPVIGETVEDAFPDTPSNRRFWFNAQNYLDETYEVGNQNQTFNGQDDIDDNGDDWLIATGIMERGVGYAATYSLFAPYPTNPSDPGLIGTASFIGPFNTGDINVSIYKNDQEADDNNWNLVGNPYPSAIDADLFLTENAAEIDENVDVIPPITGFSEGAIFFWSQDSSPSNSNNGNENENFAQSDYAIINLASEIAGGDGVTPNRYIASGQSFFISYDHAASGTPVPGGSIVEGVIRFKNSMRMKDSVSNSQFFRSTNNNKLWLNLTSDNGVFSQIGLAYVNGASQQYDGSAYDTERNLSVQRFASIYSIINGEIDRKFAIQSKGSNDLSLNEIIPIGFSTEISDPTLYTFSIPNIEGEFLNSHPIYIKDILLNSIHNLKESDYVFTSETGEFNDRFEIVFSMETLSNQDFEIDSNSLSIIELLNGNVKFNLNSNIEMESIEILDMLGRMIYKFNTQGYSQIFDLSRLSQATYIAKVKLTNGYTITKKAIKRN